MVLFVVNCSLDRDCCDATLNSVAEEQTDHVVCIFQPSAASFFISFVVELHKVMLPFFLSTLLRTESSRLNKLGIVNGINQPRVHASQLTCTV